MDKIVSNKQKIQNAVVANGTVPDEEDILSQVPQGIVLTSVLFMIMISDIDREIKYSIVHCFADDTKVR